jgi:predicted RNA binding protein YcfA (HicA-like mRNA interferase family)
VSLPVLSGADLVKALARLGFEEISQKGSHCKMRHPDGRSAIVPMHKEIALGTLRSILRQARITAEQLA